MSSIVKQQATQHWHARKGFLPVRALARTGARRSRASGSILAMPSTLPPLRLSGDAVVGGTVVPQNLPFIRVADVEL